MEEGLNLFFRFFVVFRFKLEGVKCFLKKGLYIYYSVNFIVSGRGKGMVGVGCVYFVIIGKKKYN